jgi:hypothetical protein
LFRRPALMFTLYSPNAAGSSSRRLPLRSLL